MLDRGTYVVVDEDSVQPGATVLNARVVHSIEFDSEGRPVYKSRLVIQGHRDPEKDRVVNEAPTLLRSSVRTSHHFRSFDGLQNLVSRLLNKRSSSPTSI